MLIDRYAPQDVFAAVPPRARRTDPVLVQLDRVLDDEPLVAQVRADLLRRYPQTDHHGRYSTPVEVILRLLVLKHLYHWSFAETEQWVSDSLTLRWFSRVYFQTVPDDTTLLRWANVITPPTLHALNERVAALAQDLQGTKGRKLRVDGTVVQTAIHHPTDSSLLTDGVRVLSRLVRQAKPLVGERLAGGRDAFRSRLRTMRRGLQTIHRTARQKGEAAAAQRATLDRKLIETAQQTVHQARRVREALGEATGQLPRQAQRLRERFDQFMPLVARVIAQATRRVLQGEKVPAREKVVSLFEPQPQIIQRHKSGAEVEFGRMVFMGETEGGIVASYQILRNSGSEQDAVLPAVEHHKHVFGHPPQLLVGDRGTHSEGIDAAAHAAGVQDVIIPWSGTPSATRRTQEKERRWRQLYRWRAGMEGRIFSLQRDYGLERCADHGEEGLERGVGWGLLASNLRHIGLALAR
jgi:IS5 family transposase